MKTLDFDKLATSAPLDRQAAEVRDGTGEHWDGRVYDRDSHWDAPPPMRPAPNNGTLARWAGDDDILPSGVVVQVLATDPACPDRRGAAWVRWWPTPRDHPAYRSCDLTDLDFDTAEMAGKAG